MSNYKLLVGPDKLEIDTEEIGTISLNLSIKDINNFGQRNASFSKPITVYHTKNTDRIFKSLFNINSINSFDVTKKIGAELLDDGLTILKGSLQVISVKPDSYECIIFDNFINLFTDLGDKLITGNLDASLDLYQDASLYHHIVSREYIQEQLRSIPTYDGSGYVYPIIDYDGNIDSPEYLSKSDYPILPAIAAKQVFDKILSDNGYSYVMDASTEAIFNRIYMPANPSFKDIVTDWNYAHMSLCRDEFKDWNWIHKGQVNINDGSLFWWRPLEGATMPGYCEILNRPLTDVEKLVNQYGRGGKPIPNFAIKAINYGDPSCFNLVNKGDWGTWGIDDQYQFGYRIPMDGVYNFDYGFVSRRETKYDASIYIWSDIWGEYRFFGNQFFVPSKGDLADTHPVTQGVDYKLVVNSLEATFDICSVQLDPSRNYYTDTPSSLRPYYTTGSVQGVSLKKDDIVYTVVHPSNIDLITTDISIGDVLPLKPVVDPSTFCRITKVDDYVNRGKEWNIKTMLPSNYKQVDFVNDIFKSFNFYITFDSLDNKKITIKTYDQFYRDSKILDWSDKIVEDTVYFTTFKNDTAKRYVFSMAEDEDFLNVDYKAWKKETLYTNILTNDSEFATGDNEITLTYSPTAFKNINSNVVALGVSKIYEKEHTFKTDWNKRLLFLDSVAYSYKYGGIGDASSNVTRWNYLSPKMKNNTADDNVMLGFNSSYTYQTDITVETNRNLYNLYYKSEIEPLLNTQFKVLHGKIRLNSADIIDIDFNSLIYINNNNFGNGVYRINSIKNYNPEQNVCDIELNKLYKLA